MSSIFEVKLDIKKDTSLYTFCLMSSHVTWRIRKLSLRLLTDTPIKKSVTFKTWIMHVYNSKFHVYTMQLSFQITVLILSNCLTRYLSESCNLSAAWSWPPPPGRQLPGWRWAAGDEAWTRSCRISPLAHCTVGRGYTRSEWIKMILMQSKL